MEKGCNCTGEEMNISIVPGTLPFFGHCAVYSIIRAGKGKTTLIYMEKTLDKVV